MLFLTLSKYEFFSLSFFLQKEKLYSAEQCSLVNLAYTSLLKPLSRGLYMLTIYGESLNNGTQCEDIEFLMKIMETNEDLDQVTTAESLRVIENLNTRNINQCYEILSEAFRQKDLICAKEVVIKLKYFTTIDNKIKEMELYENSWGSESTPSYFLLGFGTFFIWDNVRTEFLFHMNKNVLSHLG